MLKVCIRLTRLLIADLWSVDHGRKNQALLFTLADLMPSDQNLSGF